MLNDFPDEGTTWRYHVNVSRDGSIDNIEYFSTNFLGPLVSWDASHQGEEMHDARESDYGDIMYKRSAPKPSYVASGKIFKIFFPNFFWKYATCAI